MENLNGTTCVEGEVVLYEPTTILFKCTYENPPSKTIYKWYVNGTQRDALNSSTQSVVIPSGTTSVSCEAEIDEGEYCKCNDARTIDVTVVGKRVRWLRSAIRLVTAALCIA